MNIFLERIPLATTISIVPDVLYQSLGDEAILLDLSTERYFGLNEVGQRFWQLLTTHQDLDMIRQLLMDEYDVAVDVLYSDIDNLITQLAERHLIEVEG